MSDFQCSIIIVNYNGPHLISKCLETIEKYLAEITKEVIIIDNDSHEQNLAELATKYNYVKVIYLHENMGFGYANNVGSRNASSETLLLLNSDTELIDFSLVEVIKKYNKTSERVMWGIKLIWPDGKFQNSYCRRVTFLNFITNYTPIAFFARYFKSITTHKYSFKEFDKQSEVDVIYGTIMLLRKKYFEELGGFARKYFMYFEDIDFCDRFRKNYDGKIIFNPESTIIHNVMGSANKKVKLNKNFLKSKYTYGRDRFGLILMSLYIISDFVMQYVWITVKKLRS